MCEKVVEDVRTAYEREQEATAIEAHLLKQPHWVDTQEVFSLHSTITYNQSLIWIKLGCKLVKTDIAGIAIALSGHSGSFRTSKDYC